MSAPTPEILRFRLRVETYLRGKSLSRKAWLRADDRARRSFLKYVARKEWFSPLERYTDWRGLTCFERPPYGNYFHGYPQWHASKSELRESWERRFRRHRDAIEQAELQQERARREATSRILDLQWGIESQFIQSILAANALANPNSTIPRQNRQFRRPHRQRAKRLG